MLKLTKELFQHTPSAAYGDYYEHALYNHILASLAPDTGMPMYFVPTVSGHFKTYSQPEGSCWCCTGTGIENTARYNEAIYFHKDATLWVNLFVPSTLDWSEKGITVRLETGLPETEQVTLALACAQPTDATLRIRMPAWIAAVPTVTINGVAQPETPVAGAFLEFSRTWRDGDVIAFSLPMALRVDPSRDDPSQVSLFYGPVLLAGELGTAGMPASDQAADQWAYANLPRPPAPSLVASDPAAPAALGETRRRAAHLHRRRRLPGRGRPHPRRAAAVLRYPPHALRAVLEPARPDRCLHLDRLGRAGYMDHRGELGHPARRRAETGFRRRFRWHRHERSRPRHAGQWHRLSSVRRSPRARRQRHHPPRRCGQRLRFHPAHRPAHGARRQFPVALRCRHGGHRARRPAHRHRRFGKNRRWHTWFC